MSEHGAKTKVRISTGTSRKSLIWENKQIYYSELVSLLTKTTLTNETVAEYRAMPKAQQDTIKDIGGFVGGTLKQGRRKNGHVESRSLITLDLDNCKPDDLITLEMTASEETIIYSTHKHTAEHPRIRLVIPLTREVTADEYEAIARRIAFNTGIGMDAFDDTTYEPTRLMYWPSTSKDGEFIGKVLNGPWLNPDEVLAEYSDWRDISLWPTSSRIKAKTTHSADKAGDPLTKPGIIGAFCQAYTIEEAIETFLSDIYDPYDQVPGRYTYRGGTTGGGLILYDNKFAYSNHSTDPAGGQLCNAFDLVRIHKFGEHDINVAPDAHINQYPSYKKMGDWAAEDAEVKKIYVSALKERRSTALEDFADDVAPDETKPEAEDSEWMKSLNFTKHGKLVTDYQSILTILENDPNLKGLVGLNTFKGLPELRARAPWPRIEGEYWTDTDDAQLRGYLSMNYGAEAPGLIRDALMAAMERNAFNPVREYIEGETWDGTSRVENVFIKYLGADDSEYVRTITRKMLVAAVARIYNPGCKFDYMITLVGKQGLGKSLLIYKLGNGWTSDSLPDLRSTKAYEALDGVWLMEIGELVAMKKADRESIKLFISKTEDTYRKAYARNTTVNKRTCIFIGTTNDEDFLNDSTGARRFLVIDTNEERVQERVWNGLDKNEVAQIWAEAKVLYDAGENIMAMPDPVHEEAKAQQDSHSSENALVGIIGEFLEKRIPLDWEKRSIDERMQYFRTTNEFRDAMTDPSDKSLVERTKICTVEIWCECLQKQLGDMQRTDSWSINEVLRILGWTKHKSTGRFGPYGIQRHYRKGENNVHKEEECKHEDE